jgi:hypothetical protein
MIANPLEVMTQPWAVIYDRKKVWKINPEEPL